MLATVAAEALSALVALPVTLPVIPPGTVKVPYTFTPVDIVDSLRSPDESKSFTPSA